jgi:hypothetical protein
MRRNKLYHVVIIALLAGSAGAQDYSEAFFKDPQRVKTLEEKLPSKLTCSLEGLTRGNKSVQIAELTLPLNFEKNSTPRFDINKPTASWGAWMVYTGFPLEVNQKTLLEAKFSMVRKDIYNVSENELELQNGVLNNETIEMAFKMGINAIWHFERTGFESMNGWTWDSPRLLEDQYYTFSIDITSQQETLEGATQSQTLFGTTDNYGWLQLDGRDFFKAAADQYMFMFETEVGLREIYNIRGICKTDGKKLK